MRSSHRTEGARAMAQSRASTVGIAITLTTSRAARTISPAMMPRKAVWNAPRSSVENQPPAGIAGGTGTGLVSPSSGISRSRLFDRWVEEVIRRAMRAGPVTWSVIFGKMDIRPRCRAGARFQGQTRNLPLASFTRSRRPSACGDGRTGRGLPVVA